jgi:hypothetical protein
MTDGRREREGGEAGVPAARRAFEMRVPHRRPSAAVLVAAAVTGALVIFLVQALVLPTGWLLPARRAEAPSERIRYVAVEPAGSPAPVAERPGGDGRPRREGARSRPLVAPKSTPTGVPVAEPGAEGSAAEGGTGEVVGGGGPAEGLRPRFTDPRLWVAPGPAPRVPRSHAEELDSIVVADITADQALRGPPGRDPGDWTWERNGRKYGIDRQYIRLGRFSIPTAVLGLLPINNQQANPIELEREKRLAGMRADIQHQSQRAMNEEDFRTRVNMIRERKDRERAERLAREGAAAGSDATASPR